MNENTRKINLSQRRRERKEKESMFEEKLAEIYVQTREVLAECGVNPTRKMWEIFGNTLLAQIQGTAYWMGRALEAERKLAELQDKSKGNAS